MTETGPGLDGAIADAGGRHCRTLCGKSTGTLGGLSWASSGALPSRRDLDRLGVPFLDHQQPPQADCYGALERSAIYKVLRRFFREVTVAAASREVAPGSAEFLSASTHWLRHTFANSAVKQMQPQVLQSLPGHSDLRVTSVYAKAEAADLVRGMRAMQRAARSTPEDAARRRASTTVTPPKSAFAGGVWYGTTPRFGGPLERLWAVLWYGTTAPF